MMHKTEKSPAANGAYEDIYNHQSTNQARREQEISFAETNTAALDAGLPILWYPNAKQYGQSLRIGNPKGDPGASLWICLRTGAWKDHATGESGGDLISLYAARENIGQGDAKQKIFEMLCWKKPQFNSRPKEKFSVPVEKSRNTDLAKAIWKESINAENTPVQDYLEGRSLSHLPASLRSHPAALHMPTGRKCPTMIAAITRWPEKAPHAIHRTYLEGNKKANIKPNRMMLGSINGGAVRLAPVHDVLAVAEGIETALSVQQVTGIPAWAILSTSNYRSLVLPDTVQKIIMAADHDEAGLKAAYESAGLWTHRGYSVRIIMPPAHGQDFNDLLNKDFNNG